MSISNSWPRPDIIPVECVDDDGTHKSYDTYAYQGYLVSLSDPRQEETCFTLLSEYNLRSEWVAIPTNKEAISDAKQLAQAINEQALLGKAVAVTIRGPYPCETGHYYLIIFTGLFCPALGFVMTRRYVPQKALEIAKTELERQLPKRQLMTPVQQNHRRFLEKKVKIWEKRHAIYQHGVEQIPDNGSRRGRGKATWQLRCGEVGKKLKAYKDELAQFDRNLGSGPGEQAQGFTR